MNIAEYTAKTRGEETLYCFLSFPTQTLYSLASLRLLLAEIPHRNQSGFKSDLSIEAETWDFHNFVRYARSSLISLLSLYIIPPLLFVTASNSLILIVKE